MNNLVTTSNELMEDIASYMDDELREQTHFLIEMISGDLIVFVKEVK